MRRPRYGLVEYFSIYVDRRPAAHKGGKRRKSHERIGCFHSRYILETAVIEYLAIAVLTIHQAIAVISTIRKGFRIAG